MDPVAWPGSSQCIKRSEQVSNSFSVVAHQDWYHFPCVCQDWHLLLCIVIIPMSELVFLSLCSNYTCQNWYLFLFHAEVTVCGWQGIDIQVPAKSASFSILFVYVICQDWQLFLCYCVWICSPDMLAVCTLRPYHALELLWLLTEDIWCQL